MTEQSMMRLAMVLQNQAPTTLDKYITNLVENILFNHPKGMDVVSLAKSLNDQFNLSFTVDEIANALKKKGAKRIILESGNYSLSPKVKNSLSKKTTPLQTLEALIELFLESEQLDYNTENFSKLLKKYFYFAFNSNIENLLFLINKSDININSFSFEADNEEIQIINRFLMWNNAEKDEFVYSLVAICYEYCMLTVKNDEMISSELFKGKKFFLDANIIFRMAGINNEERQFATQSFVKHCKKVGIELSCTSGTLDEVYHVLISQVEHLRETSGTSMPVSYTVLERLNPHTDINDFYRIYYDWCKVNNSSIGDFLSFHQYLLSKIQYVIKSLNIVESSTYKATTQAKNFEAQAIHLKEFKSNRKRFKPVTTASAETDATNILDVIKWRNRAGASIWQTNEFIVSADQGLIAWAKEVYPGVPIVVLPSVWLSLILRFTGRTDDDYKSFCLFLTQRQHIAHKDIVDATRILSTLNPKTNNQALKEQIIIELTQNKHSYKFDTNDDYDTSINHAFDKVLEEQMSSLKMEMDKKLVHLAQSTEEKVAERAKMKAASERERTIDILAKQKANEILKKWIFFAKFKWLLYILGGASLLTGWLIWALEIDPLYSWVLGLIPVKLIDANNVSITWTIMSTIVGLFVLGLGCVVSQLSSDERKTKLIEKYKKKFYEETEI